MFQTNEFTGITVDMQNYFAKISNNIDILNGDYLDNKYNDNFKEMVKHLFPQKGGDDILKILNPGSHIGEIVNDKIMNYIGDPGLTLDYEFDFFKLVQSLLSTGYILVGKEQIEGKEKIRAIDGSKYYYDGESEWLIEIYEVQEYDTTLAKFKNSKNYLHVQRYKQGVIYNTLYDIKKDQYQFGDKVPLDTIEQIKDLPEEKRLDIDSLVHRTKVEKAMVDKIRKLIYSLDRKGAEAEKQYNRYTEQFKIFRNIDIPENAYKEVELSDGTKTKAVDFDKLGKMVLTDAALGDGGIEIVENMNALLVQMFDFYDRQVKTISNLTDIPLFFFGIQQEGGNDSGTSKIKSSGAFYKRIRNYRKKIKGAFESLSEKFGIKIDITFDDIIKMEEDELVKIEGMKVTNKFTTRKMAIMKVHNVDALEAEKILQEILEEDKLLEDNKPEQDANN